MLPNISGEFTAVNDPELRFTPSGKAVANVRIVANSKRKNEKGEWEDDKVVWLNLTAWGQLAENIAESVEKGTRILVKGRLETREYTTKDGDKRSSYDVTADEVGPSLAFATAKVSKSGRSSGTAKTEDAWSTGSSAQADEPPF